MKKGLLLIIVCFFVSVSSRGQTTPALSNLAKGVYLEMTKSALMAARPEAMAEDSLDSAEGQIWFSETVETGNVSFLSFHVDKKGKNRLVGTTVYFWEPNALDTGNLFFGQPTTPDKKGWAIKNSTGKKVNVRVGEPNELIFELVE
jgi:hypothetical protein